MRNQHAQRLPGRGRGITTVRAPDVRAATRLKLPQDLTPAGLAVLTYVSRQRLRFWQHIPRSEIVLGAGLPSGLASAGLVECVERGWLDPIREAHDTLYTLVVGRRRAAAPVRN